MILLDTSVLIVYLRTADARLAGLFATHGAAVCGVIRAEIWHGVRAALERTFTAATFAVLSHIAIPDPLWDAVGDNLARHRRVGLPMPFTDVVIATVAVAAGVELWTRDGHFAQMQPHLPGLRLFAEPP